MPLRPWILIAAVVSLAAGAVACNKTNDGFCCVTAAGCEASGAEITPCTDPARPVCDEAGELGPRNGCVADPGATDCDGPEDCAQDRPFCIDGACRECEDGGDCGTDVPVCSDAFLCGPCADDDQCTDRAATPRCDTEEGGCVECLDAGDCASAEAPICDDASHACRGCRADAECASEVCLEDTATCADTTDVIYVATTGAASGTCTQEAPCNTVALGLAQVAGERNVIKVAPGTYMGQVTISGLTVTITGKDANLRPTGLDQDVVVIGNGAVVTLEGVRISSAGGLSAVGVRCARGAGAKPTVNLRGVAVASNQGGGVAIDACDFTIVNSWIVNNGSSQSTTGGVTIANITAGGTRVMDFNTIYDNTTADGVAAGVLCSVVVPSLVFENNIVFDNEAAAQVAGANCAYEYSDIGPVDQPGDGNINASPQFVDATGGDFHLVPESAARDAADPDATLVFDIDGDLRPQGAVRDMGADEVVP